MRLPCPVVSHNLTQNNDMRYINAISSFAILFVFISGCNTATSIKEGTAAEAVQTPAEKKIEVGATNFSEYLPALQNKRVGMVVNNTSLVGDTHLVDTLLSLNVAIKKIFAPEHGFRGDLPAGDTVKNDIDSKTGIPILSLYGSHYKPTPEEMADLDVLVFDIQDVGARFYTYTSTMSYAMEASAENNVKFFVLDRPNPIGHFVDGPVLEPAQKSFVGLYPIPIAYGLTMGELATMINEEGWLANGVKADLTVVKLRNWNHNSKYSLPVKPSPNLPTDNSIAWYPSTCLFEGTMMSLGRGTYFPFEVVGYPSPEFGDFQFTPVSIADMATDPRHEGKVCYGVDLREIAAPSEVDLSYLISFYKKTPAGKKFFINYFELLAGTTDLRRQIEQGLSEEEIRASWQPGLEKYKAIRKKHLLYPDFNEAAGNE